MIRVVRSLLFVATLVYLVFELAFNAHLLDVVGGVMSPADVRQLEYYGRLLAATGLVLFILHRAAGGLRLSPRWLLIALLAWPLVFFGEKQGISWASHQFGPREQATAFAAGMLRDGMALHAVTLKGVPFARDHNVPADKTLLAMLGVATFSNPRFVAEVTGHLDAIAFSVAQAQVRRMGDSPYRDYVDFWNTLAAHYRHDYLPASDRYRRAITQAPANAAQAWAKANEELSDQGWSRYRDAVAKFHHAVQRQSRDLLPQLRSYFKHRQGCHGWSYCLHRVDAHYEAQAKRLLGTPTPPWTHWCVRLKRHFFTLPIKVNGSGGEHSYYLGVGPEVNTNKYRCDLTQSSVEKDLQPLLASRFESKTGYPADIKTRAAFIANKGSSRALAEAARKHGASIPDGWNATQTQEWKAAVAEAIRRSARRQWRDTIMSRYGVYVVPGLSWTSFSRSHAAKQAMLSHLGVWARPGLSAASFERYVLPYWEKHQARVPVSAYRRILDGRDGVLGRAALLGMIVPPVALGLSLLFSMLNAFNVVFDVLAFMRVPIIRHTPRVVLVGIAAILIAAVPFAMSNPISNSGPFRVLLDDMKTQAGPGAYALDWLIRAEPAFYVVGRQALRVVEAGDGAASSGPA